jgi:hypothetical protein
LGYGAIGVWSDLGVKQLEYKQLDYEPFGWYEAIRVKNYWDMKQLVYEAIVA